jgi:DnaJ-domain-containing protein 1
MELASVLEDAGIALSEVEIDSDGFTAELRAMTERMCVVLQRSIDSDSIRHPEEIAQAAQILVGFTGGLLTEDQAGRMLNNPLSVVLEPDKLDYEERITLLQAAIMVAGADGSLNDPERRFLVSFARSLAFPPTFVEHMIRRTIFGEKTPTENHEGDNEVALARITLGVDYSSTLAEIKRKYRELVVIHHPDVAGGHGLSRNQAEEITKMLNWAYDLLKREVSARSWSNH